MPRGPSRHPTQGVIEAARAIIIEWRRVTNQQGAGRSREIPRFPEVWAEMTRLWDRLEAVRDELQDAQQNERIVDERIIARARTTLHGIENEVRNYVSRARQVDFTPEAEMPFDHDALVSHINRLRIEGLIRVTSNGTITWEDHARIEHDGRTYDMGPMEVRWKTCAPFHIRIKPTRDHRNRIETPYLRHERGYFHPHIQPSGALCPGELSGRYIAGVTTMRVPAVMAAVRGFLNTYNRASPYVQIQSFQHFGPRQCRSIQFSVNGQWRMNFAREVFMNPPDDARWSIAHNVEIRPADWISAVEAMENGTTPDVSGREFILRYGRTPAQSIDIEWSTDDPDSLRVRTLIPARAINATSSQDLEDVMQQYQRVEEIRDAVNQAAGVF